MTSPTLSELVRLQKEASEAPWRVHDSGPEIEATERYAIKNERKWIFTLYPHAATPAEANLAFVAAARNFDFRLLQTQYEAMREFIKGADHQRFCAAMRLTAPNHCSCGLEALQDSLDTKARGDGNDR